MSGSAPVPELVIAGNLLIDDIVLRDGRTLMGEPGGALLYGALAAALWGTRVGLVSVLGDDYPRATLEALAARGIDLGGLRPNGAPSLRAWLLYERAGRRMVHQLGSPSHAAVSPRFEMFPPEWTRAPIVHLSPMPREQQEPLARALREHGAAGVTLDPHERFESGDAASWEPLIAQLDGLFVSHEELDLPGTPAEQATRLATRGFVAIKRGAAGGWLRDVGSGAGFAWPARSEGIVDTTGAGDAFAAGFLAGRIAGDPLERCCQRGVVSASFALEDWGARGLLGATRAEAERRLSAWFGAAPTPAGGAATPLVAIPQPPGAA